MISRNCNELKCICFQWCFAEREITNVISNIGVIQNKIKVQFLYQADVTDKGTNI